MASVHAHYETLLAPVYLWMAGGIEHALALGASDIAGLPARGRKAVDLGAGFGMHAIPLARAGCEVTAIDASAHLLAELARHGRGLGIRLVEDDLLNFDVHLSGKVDLVLCMGDTLTHLQDVDQVRTLMKKVAAVLQAGGRFVATFRDYSALPAGEARFIPVRSDAGRIHTCFLEEEPRHVRVHDIVHERTAGDTWTTRVGSYSKLRLSRETAIDAATSAGLRARLEPGPRGMLRLHADA